MNSDSQSDDVHISVVCDNEFAHYFDGERADPIPLTRIKFQIGETTISGDRFWIQDRPIDFFLKLLATIDGLSKSKRQFFGVEDQPRLLFEPIEETRVRVTFCLNLESVHDPDERLGIEPTAIAALEDLRTESIRAAEELISHILELAPRFDTHPYIVELREEIERVRRK